MLMSGTFTLLAASSGHACTCMQQPEAQAAMTEAVAVFSGVVESVAQEGADSIVSLQVSGAWKGAESSSMAIRTVSDPEACGFDFKVGGAYLVYAYPGTPAQGGALATTSCTRTCPMAEAAGDLAELGPASPPTSSEE